MAASGDPVQSAAHHVEDAALFEFPFGYQWPLPKFGDFQITKFMVLEVVAAVLLLAIFIPIARRALRGGPPKGRLWNMFEAMVLFIRNEVVRPAIGPDHPHGDDHHGEHHSGGHEPAAGGNGHGDEEAEHHARAAVTYREADRFLPYILTVFFFILVCNLLGMIPWLGSPTGSINVTAVLAVMSLCVSLWAGMSKFGPIRFWLGLAPRMDLPKPMAILLVPMILVIEIFGLFIKHTILAVRLLANMFAGHLVLGVIVGFIPLFAGSVLWWGVMPAAIFGATALSMLELFVAFLQAYVFAFLSALFIGMCVHQH